MELVVPIASIAVALALLAAGYLIGRRGRVSHVVFLPADRPIPVDSEHWQRLAEESAEESEGEEPAIRTPLALRIIRFVFKAFVIALAIIGIAALVTC